MSTSCSRCGGSIMPDGYGDLRCSMCARLYGPQEQLRLERPVATRWDKMGMAVTVPKDADEEHSTGEWERRKRNKKCRDLLSSGMLPEQAAQESGVAIRTAYRIAWALRMAAQRGE